MFESTRVVGAMVKMYIFGGKARKEYGYGNQIHGVKESREVIYRLMQKLTGDMIKASGMEFNIRGTENLPKEGPVLYVANHSSIFDPVVLVNVINDPCILVGKKEISNMPLINKWFDALGCIYIDREDKRQSLECILKGINELKSGQSIIIFPEGTRTSGDDMKPFKEGTFKLALKSGVPVVPIAIKNTDKVYEETKLIKKTDVYINIGNMIETSKLDAKLQKQLPKIAEDAVKKLLEEIINDI